jgi:hypothetical protein
MPKKRTYITKTDLKAQKPWLKKVHTSEYKVETENLKKTILIICEGENTEPLYFKSFPVSTLTVKIFGLGQSKLKLIESAENIQKNESFDELWCVFDLDIKSNEENCVPDFNNAITKAQDLGFKVAYSNDAFELWFYLHYYYNDCENHRTFYYEQLSQLWNVNYEKEGKKWKFCSENLKRLQNDKRASQGEAIKRAKKLHEDRKELQYHLQNPVTLVFELVELLIENMKK